MRRYWWTVWIKVAVVALVLFLGYRYVDNKIDTLISPYILDESDISEAESSSAEETETSELPEKTETMSKPMRPGETEFPSRPHGHHSSDKEDKEEDPDEPDKIDKKNLLTNLLNKFQDTLGVKLDLENMLFDYANDYAQQMKEESDAARHPGTGN